MGFVDADTHIVEDDMVWGHIPKADLDVKPKVVAAVGDSTGLSPTGEYFLIDGDLYEKGGKQLISYTDGTRTFTAPGPRIAQMNEWDIDTQVIYTSLFLGLATKTARTELVLARSWNSTMNDVCQQHKGRFYYIAVPSAKNVPETVADMKKWRDGGACGLMMRVYEDDKILTHKDFYPIYAKAEELGLPICIHIGQGSRAMKQLQTTPSGISVAIPNLIAFGALMNSHIPTMFPKLKFGIIESGSSWLPFALSRTERYRERYTNIPAHGAQMLADGRLFITCEEHEDIPEIVKLAGRDTLMLGTDYGHSDTSTELRAHDKFMKRNDVDQELARKITSDNARRFYAFS